MIAIPYTHLTKQNPSFTSDALPLNEDDVTYGVMIDRSVTDGMTMQPESVSYLVAGEFSQDGGVTWSHDDLYAQTGGLSLGGSGTAEDPWFVNRWDGTQAALPQGSTHFRVVITATELQESTPVGILGFIQSSSNPDISIGWPQN